MNAIEKQNVDNEKDSELYILKEKVKDLMTNLALAQVECEEMELNQNNLKNENSKLEDTIEEVYKEKRKVIK